jgi:hypothetical protein
MMPIIFRTRRGVAKYVRQALHEFRPKLCTRFYLPHRIIVHVVPGAVLEEIGGDGLGFGAFLVIHGEPHIVLASGLSWWIRQKKIPRAEMIGQLLRTFVHELVHYEQWRDGRWVQERGVRVRTRALCRKLGLTSD